MQLSRPTIWLLAVLVTTGLAGCRTADDQPVAERPDTQRDTQRDSGRDSGQDSGRDSGRDGQRGVTWRGPTYSRPLIAGTIDIAALPTAVAAAGAELNLEVALRPRLQSLARAGATTVVFTNVPPSLAAGVIQVAATENLRAVVQLANWSEDLINDTPIDAAAVARDVNAIINPGGVTALVGYQVPRGASGPMREPAAPREIELALAIRRADPSRPVLAHGVGGRDPYIWPSTTRTPEPGLHVLRLGVPADEPADQPQATQQTAESVLAAEVEQAEQVDQADEPTLESIGLSAEVNPQAAAAIWRQFHRGIAHGATLGVVVDAAATRLVTEPASSATAAQSAAIRRVLRRAGVWLPVLHGSRTYARQQASVPNARLAWIARGQTRFILLYNDSLEQYSRGSITLEELTPGEQLRYHDEGSLDMAAKLAGNRLPIEVPPGRGQLLERVGGAR